MESVLNVSLACCYDDFFEDEWLELEYVEASSLIKVVCDFL